LLAKKHVTGLDELTSEARHDLADILKRVTTRYDNLFETPFPYTMGFHQRPTEGQPHSYFHFHAHFFPPLLRSASVRKCMVGFELLGGPQRDITAEAAPRVCVPRVSSTISIVRLGFAGEAPAVPATHLSGSQQIT
jgi:UDPglucose--hexose-1-phosphate uridylyltransferase